MDHSVPKLVPWLGESCVLHSFKELFVHSGLNWNKQLLRKWPVGSGAKLAILIRNFFFVLFPSTLYAKACQATTIRLLSTDS